MLSGEIDDDDRIRAIGGQLPVREMSSGTVSVSCSSIHGEDQRATCHSQPLNGVENRNLQIGVDHGRSKICTCGWSRCGLAVELRRMQVAGLGDAAYEQTGLDEQNAVLANIWPNYPYHFLSLILRLLATSSVASSSHFSSLSSDHGHAEQS